MQKFEDEPSRRKPEFSKENLELTKLLDRVCKEAPISISAEIIRAVQQNRIGYDQAEIFSLCLSDFDSLDLKSERAMDLFRNDLEQLLYFVRTDPQSYFIEDLGAQSRLQTSLQDALDRIVAYLEIRTQRSREPLAARGFLLKQLRTLMYEKQAELTADTPELVQPCIAVLDQILAAAELLPPEICESRGYLIRILSFAHQAAKVTQGEFPQIQVHQRSLDDALIMIKDL